MLATGLLSERDLVKRQKAGWVGWGGVGGSRVVGGGGGGGVVGWWGCGGGWWGCGWGWC